MKYGYREVRKISAESMRGLCISKGWYTRGDNEDYRHLLVDLVEDKENITTDDIVEIAQDIIKHSNTDWELESICFEIARIAVTFFEAEPLKEQEIESYEPVSGEKKIWYCVTSSFDDKGRGAAAITNTCEATIQPKGSFKSTKRKDIYRDWYGSVEEANKAVKEAMAL